MPITHQYPSICSHSVAVDGPTAVSLTATVHDPESLAPTRRPAARRVGGLIVSAVVVIVVFLLVQNKMPSAHQMLDAVARANACWIVVALTLQVAALIMLSDQQRRLLAQLGTGVDRSRMTAITVASAAVSLTVPAGGALGAGWSFRQYRRLGASRAAASTVTLVSGLAGTVGLVILAALMWATRQIAGSVSELGLGAYGAGVVLVLLSVAGYSLWTVLSAWLPSRRHVERRTVATTSADDRLGLLARIRREVGNAIGLTRGLGSQGWRNATAASIANRVLDAACLYVCCLAVGASVDFIALALVYLGIQVVRQIPLTPGGFGVVEVAMLTGLTSIGMGVATGAAVVILYRLIAAWLIVPIGLGALLVLQRKTS